MKSPNDDDDHNHQMCGHDRHCVSHHHSPHYDSPRFSCPIRLIVHKPEQCRVPVKCPSDQVLGPIPERTTHYRPSFMCEPQQSHTPFSSIRWRTMSYMALCLLVARMAQCSASPSPPLNTSIELGSTQSPSGTLHHHHHAHIRLTKLLFPLASSSFTEHTFNPLPTPLPIANSSHSTTMPGSVKRYIGRKRKRELFALTIAEDQPIKTLGTETFWPESVTTSRRRRMSPHGAIIPSSFALHSTNKQKPFDPLSALSSPSGVSGANVAGAGNMRMKIMMNPSPFGAAFVPDQKCNFEIYPSGCFDENGSICDTSGSGLCVCRPGYSIRIGSVYCLRPSAIGEACYTTEQCERKVLHSGCFNYREEYREENPSAFFGPSQSSWPMGECRCRIGHRYDEVSKSCVRSLIGSWCSNVWDCELVEDDEKGGEGTDSHSRVHERNHTRSGTANPALHYHGHPHTPSRKLANIVCEHNICNCSQFFHYNTSAEKCHFVETYGQACRPGAQDGALHPKRNTRSHVAPLPNLFSARHRQSTYHTRQLQALPDDSPLVTCNMPTVCSANLTCACAEGFEHQPLATPQCQSINKGVGVGSHYTHYLHGGSSGRAGVGKDGSVSMFDRGAHYEGQSNVANFVEYVLYVLVPALVVIFTFKPCFRRIGEWRNHIHQYNSDSDFYLSGNALPPVIAEVNVIAPAVDKTVPGAFTSYLPHMGCHNAYIFESTDGCYAYGSTCLPPPPTTDPSLALVREKLQTIDETGSEDTSHECTYSVPANAINNNNQADCCLTTTTRQPLKPLDHSSTVECELPDTTKDERRLAESHGDGIEMMQFGKNDSASVVTAPKDDDKDPLEKAEAKDL